MLRFRPSETWPFLVLPLVLLVAGMASLRLDSATFDETAHVAAGFTYLDRHDFRLNPEHPPLSKAWAALPLWLAGRGPVSYGPEWSGGHGPDQWRFGYEFLNGPIGASQRRDPRARLLPARRMMLLPALALAAIVVAWSWEWWGREGALMSLFLFCLSPTVLAHARLVTTDLASALGFVGSLYAFWRFTRSPGWPRACVVGLSVAVSLLIKFSCLLLGPMLLALAGLWIARPEPGRVRRLRWSFGAGAVVAGIAVLGIWAGYGFRFAVSPQGYELDWSIVGGAPGWVDWALGRRLLPESYLYGLSYVLGGAVRRSAFLNGAQSITGWWYYFPEAFLIKSPPALVILLGWLGYAGFRRSAWRRFEPWFLAIPIALYLILSMNSHLNIGHRHLMPIYPLLHVALGGAAVKLVGSRATRRGLIVLLLGYAVSFAIATPRYLSYFNVSVGGAKHGWHYLLDSNVDWGQDLARLEGWMERRGRSRIHLAYFGTADPEAYGIRYDKVLLVHDFDPARPSVRPGSGEWVAISVNLLQGLYTSHDRDLARELLRRRWITPDQATEFLDLRNTSSLAGREPQEFEAWLLKTGIVDERRLRDASAELLSTWLERLRDEGVPVGRVGDSILVLAAP